MKTINQKTVSIVGILIFTLMLGTASAVQTNLTELADDSVANRLTDSPQVSNRNLKFADKISGRGICFSSVYKTRQRSSVFSWTTTAFCVCKICRSPFGVGQSA